MDPGKRLVLSGLSEHHTQVKMQLLRAQPYRWPGWLYGCVTESALLKRRAPSSRCHAAQACSVPPLRVLDFAVAMTMPLTYLGHKGLGCADLELCLRCCAVLAQMDQFFFMADRHDPSFCCVRYMTDVRLREWKVYLQPVAKRELRALVCCKSECATCGTRPTQASGLFARAP